MSNSTSPAFDMVDFHLGPTRGAVTGGTCGNQSLLREHVGFELYNTDYLFTNHEVFFLLGAKNGSLPLSLMALMHA